MTAPDSEHQEPHHRHAGPVSTPRPGGTPIYAWGVVALALIGIIIYLLVDHWPHVVAALPYLGIIAMMLMHIFGHGGHGKAGSKNGGGPHSDH
ncbi:DUF2933 domain-containing protein [Nesterenkonia alkaliphila]|uniref:DUF2933 domain-containing protein n=1 Tax=Nesterenkonia alkaliphila TaxID=1463631 RepID=A0A7K1UL43_9MICC|nr:DUF2933 domain-containing protein [Nesterenkonia alkaliphila]MVT27052.1 DUF2933 domain-containing protein [Nesterenkonia alkaliphila]GFZ93864.1 hypothetical protein GCM10011359_24170 [Nesterenkonia alkaliphila]